MLAGRTESWKQGPNYAVDTREDGANRNKLAFGRNIRRFDNTALEGLV